MVITKIFLVIPVPCGSTTAPLNCCSAFLVSRFRLSANSIDSSNFAVAVFLTNSTASSFEYNFVLSTILIASTYFFPFFIILPPYVVYADYASHIGLTLYVYTFYYSTLIPILIAVPSTIFIASSTVYAFKSGNLISAISLI